MRVLIIDDSRVVLDILERALQVAGIEALSCTSAEEAVRLLFDDGVHVDVCAIDWHLNGPMTAPDLTRIDGALLCGVLAMRDHRAWRLIYSSNPCTDRERAYLAGCGARDVMFSPAEYPMDFITHVTRREPSGPASGGSNGSGSGPPAYRDKQGRWCSRGRDLWRAFVGSRRLEEIAHMLAVTPATVSALAHGARRPSLDLAAEIEFIARIPAAAWTLAPIPEDRRPEPIQLPVETNSLTAAHGEWQPSCGQAGFSSASPPRSRVRDRGT